MTVSDDDEKQTNAKDVTQLKFEPVLNVKDQVKDNTVHTKVGKCTVDSDLGILAVESYRQISCINIQNKKEIFSQDRGKTNGAQMFTHSWVVINAEKYLAFQSNKNTIQFFKVKPDDNSFTDAKELTICLDQNDTISCLEFDENGENIILVKNKDTLEKRAVKNGNDVLISIQLQQNITPASGTTTLSLSNDGKWCVIGGGANKSYFYLIEIDKKVQH
eukprot:148613_1